MSTFDGVVKEFPAVRIDHFRSTTDSNAPLPLAYFLSHVHSDHLEGLESCRSPFIYCSPATREILLRLEKYPHRMNFAKGILEGRKQTYKHLRRLLKAIPLDTPTDIDLAPGQTVRVTLLNANHCVGAVMFLIEGNGNAILYTGDVRSEVWWVNALTRHPMLLPYVSYGGKKPLRQLDCIYLDTTFASKSTPYKHFPTKAEGVTELLQKVAQYPEKTIFYFDSWTFGYEDVWVALSSFLGCPVHMDGYRWKLYNALATANEPKALEGPQLVGFTCGNHLQRGCLTDNASTRLHSCEQGTGCEVFEQDFVRITPIISRNNDGEIVEAGAGGGKGDLDKQHELEVFDPTQLGALIQLCTEKLHHQPAIMAKVVRMLASLFENPAEPISLHAAAFMNDGDETGSDTLPLADLVPALVELTTNHAATEMELAAAIGLKRPDRTIDGLPTRITFPYSRHSSYTELCHLVEAFKPTDIHPCTVNRKHWSPEQSMAFLFGHLYDHIDSFMHDRVMLRTQRGQAIKSAKSINPVQDQETQVSGEELYDPVHRDNVNSSPERTFVERYVAHRTYEPLDPGSHSIITSENMQTPNERDMPATEESDSLPDSASPPLQRLHADSAILAVLETHRPLNKYSISMTQPNAEMAMTATGPLKYKRPRLEESTSTAPPPHRTAVELFKTLASTAPPLRGWSTATSPTQSLGRLSPESLSSARKQEAYDAALAVDWDNITLVSVSGHHQEIEVEL